MTLEMILSLSNTLLYNIWNSNNVARISDNYITPITPVNGTFQIWGIIYLMLIWYVLQPSDCTRSEDFLQSMELNRGWINSFVNKNFQESVAILQGLQAVNSKIAENEIGMSQFAFDIYTTWTQFATLVNQAVVNTSFTEEQHLYSLFNFINSMIGKPLRFGEILTIIWSCAGVLPRLSTQNQTLLLRKVDQIIKQSSPSKILKNTASIIMNSDFEKYSNIPYTIHLPNIDSSYYAVSTPEYSESNLPQIGSINIYKYENELWSEIGTLKGSDALDGIRCEFISENGQFVIIGSRDKDWTQCYFNDDSGVFTQIGDTIFAKYTEVHMEPFTMFIRNNGTYIYTLDTNSEWQNQSFIPQV